MIYFLLRAGKRLYIYSEWNFTPGQFDMNVQAQSLSIETQQI